MMKQIFLTLDYEWQGTLEEKLTLTSEYRLIEDKINDTLSYLDELEEEETRIYNMIMSKIRIIEK